MKHQKSFIYLILLGFSLFSHSLFAQNGQAQSAQTAPPVQQQVVPAPQETYVGQPVGRKVGVGKEAAQKYFSNESAQDKSSGRVGDNMLMLHLGRYFESQAYSWGTSPSVSSVGQGNYGVTYLFDQWHGMDMNIRVDYLEYDVSGTRATKLSFLPLITFPRTETRFPLYFGIGMGPGIFTQQVKNKSSISFDYQLVVGLRFMELFEGVGAFVEFGMKNHLHILSEGQLNGMTLTFGPIFNF